MKIWKPEEVQPWTSPWPAVVTNIVDADTMDLLVNVGWDIKGLEVRIRLVDEGVLTGEDEYFDAWEVRGEQRVKGLLAEERATELIPVGSEVLIFSKKGGSKGSFKRWLCVILYKDEDGNYRSLADVLRSEGHEKPRKKKR